MYMYTGPESVVYVVSMYMCAYGFNKGKNGIITTDGELQR
jgi:hypothetical protein